MNRLAYLARVLWNKLTVPQKVFYIFVIIMLLLAGKETYEGEYKKQSELNEAITMFYKISLPELQNITRIEISNRLGGTYSISYWYNPEKCFDTEINYYRKVLLVQGYIESKENSFTKDNNIIEIRLKNWGDNTCLFEIATNRARPVYGKE